MKLGSLFSGVGGLDLAVEAVLGARTAWHSELDPAASTVLAHRWPGVPNHGDITRIDWTVVEPVDVICGGFPCQDISSAGRGAGIKEGTRSGLWYRYADAIRSLRPRLVVVENVAALLVRGLDIVLGDLAEIGYDTRWTSVRASDVGAPHRRERIFLVAWPAADASHVGHERTGAPRRRGDGPADSGRPAADTDGAGLDRCTQRYLRPQAGQQPPLGGDAHRLDLAERWGTYAPSVERWERLTRPAPAPTDERGRLNPSFVEWMMGLPDGWVCDLVGRSDALRLLGNGVVPQQAEAALSWLLFDTLDEGAA